MTGRRRRCRRERHDDVVDSRQSGPGIVFCENEFKLLLFYIYIIIYNINTVYSMLNKYDKLQITRVQYPGTVLNHIHSTVYTVYDNMI